MDPQPPHALSSSASENGCCKPAQQMLLQRDLLPPHKLAASTERPGMHGRGLAMDSTAGEVVIGGYGSCVTVSGMKVYSTRDALTIFEACRQGILPRVVRRLTDREKQQIDDGTIIVFDEKEAKMKRWTDGRLWTPSRILDNFLVYRELERKLQPNQEGTAEIARWTRNMGHKPAVAFGSNKGVFFLKPYGLMKKTISLSVPDNEQEYLSQVEWRPPRVHQQHLVAYFRAETASQLPTPGDMEELLHLRLPLPLLRIQRFRRPLKIEIGEDLEYDIHESDDDEDVEGATGGSGAGRCGHSGALYLSPGPGLALDGCALKSEGTSAVEADAAEHWRAVSTHAQLASLLQQQHLLGISKALGEIDGGTTAEVDASFVGAQNLAAYQCAAGGVGGSDMKPLSLQWAGTDELLDTASCMHCTPRFFMNQFHVRPSQAQQQQPLSDHAPFPCIPQLINPPSATTATHRRHHAQAHLPQQTQECQPLELVHPQELLGSTGSRQPGGNIDAGSRHCSSPPTPSTSLQ